MVELLKLLRGYSSFPHHTLVAEYLYLVPIMNKVEEYQLLSGSSLRAYPPCSLVLVVYTVSPQGPFAHNTIPCNTTVSCSTVSSGCIPSYLDRNSAHVSDNGLQSIRGYGIDQIFSISLTLACGVC